MSATHTIKYDEVAQATFSDIINKYTEIFVGA